MIVTVTLNAALDVSYEADGLSWQSTRDVSRVRHRAGGRGVAVARVLHTFGHEVLAAGLAGGATGELIREDLGRSGIPVAFTGIGRESRRVLEVTDTASGRTMRLREPGPYVTTEELGRFAADYRRMLADATAVVLCGTLPAGLPPEIYGSLATYAAEAGVPVILNAGGSALRYAASRRPDLDLVVPDTADDVVSRPDGSQAGRADGAYGAGETEGAPAAYGGEPLASREALLRLGASAVAIPSGGRVRVVTKAGRWNASLASPGTGGPGTGNPASPGTGDPASPGTGDPASPGTGDPASPGTGDPASPGTGDPASPGTGDPASPGTGDPASPETGDPASPGTGDPASPGTGDPASPGTGDLASPGTGDPASPGTGDLASPGTGDPASPGTGDLAGTGTGDPDGAVPGSLGALVAGLVPGLLLGWSWPDLLRHAVAAAAAADPSGDVNLAVYERLVDGVTVETVG